MKYYLTTSVLKILKFHTIKASNRDMKGVKSANY